MFTSSLSIDRICHSITFSNIVVLTIAMIIAVNYFPLRDVEAKVRAQVAALTEDIRYTRMISASKEKAIADAKAESLQRANSTRECGIRLKSVESENRDCNMAHMHVEEKLYEAQIIGDRCKTQLNECEDRERRTKIEIDDMVRQRASWPKQDIEMINFRKQLLDAVVRNADVCKQEQEDIKSQLKFCASMKGTNKEENEKTVEREQR